MADETPTPVFKKRGGIWSVIGVLLVAGIVGVGAWKYFSQTEPETPPKPEPKAPKHLIVISIDTLRADHLACYGYAKPTSPNIDAIARGGVVFERHYSSYPLTLPAHLTQLTGVSSLGHRVRDNLYHSLPAKLQTLPEVMKAQGFRTGAFVSAHTMKGGSGIERGFEVYDDRDVRTLAAGDLTIKERIAPDTLKLAGDWISGQGSDRMFCYIHLFDPHAPYEPHSDLGADFQGSDAARYDGEIAYVDREIGRFMLRLDEIGVLKDAMVVITSDHGEGLGQHFELTHGYYCYDSTTHVPLIIKGAPGVKEGTRVPALVANYDLAPTLVELMGLESREFVAQMHGQSLVGAMRDGQAPDRAGVYIESHYAHLNANWAKIRGLRGKETLTLFAGAEALHFADAEQETDSAPGSADAVSAARSEIERLMSSWMPPAGGRGTVRESTVGTPYPGESAVAQDFEAERINDTGTLPSPHARKLVLRSYQAAELDYDGGLFEDWTACADKLRVLLKTEPDFLMAQKLLAAVDLGMIGRYVASLGVLKAKELAREAADCLKRVSELEGSHGRVQAQESARRDYARLLVWLNDIKTMRELANASDDPAVDWMFHLVSYRVATKQSEPEAAQAAGKFLKAQPPGLPWLADAEKDLLRMQAGEKLKLAPWEQ